MRARTLITLVVLGLLSACGDDNASQSQPAEGSGQDVNLDVNNGSGEGTGDGTGEGTGTVVELTGCDALVDRLELGTIQLGDNGLSPEVTFDVADCSQSFTIIIIGEDAVSYLAYELFSPSGVAVVTSNAADLTRVEEYFLGPFAAQFKSPNRVVQGDGAAAALIPNAPSSAIETGTWRLTIYGGTLDAQTGVAPHAGPVDVTILFKNHDTEPEGGTLDLNMYFTGAGGMSAATAPTDEVFEAALAELRTIYSPVGITIDEVRYYDTDAAFRTITGISGSGDLAQMFKTGAGNPPGLSFFFVERFQVAEAQGGTIGGIAGGIPGPPLSPGTARGGVAVAYEAAASIAQENGGTVAGNLAHVMGHEGGHQLGLAHVVEFIPSIQDPLPDTPYGGDAETNLMYPTVGGDTTLTPQQQRVFHNNPEVAQ